MLPEDLFLSEGKKRKSEGTIVVISFVVAGDNLIEIYEVCGEKDLLNVGDLIFLVDFYSSDEFITSFNRKVN